MGFFGFFVCVSFVSLGEGLFGLVSVVVGGFVCLFTWMSFALMSFVCVVIVCVVCFFKSMCRSLCYYMFATPTTKQRE